MIEKNMYICLFPFEVLTWRAKFEFMALKDWNGLRIFMNLDSN